MSLAQHIHICLLTEYIEIQIILMKQAEFSLA
jgi:hypothetical protein